MSEKKLNPAARRRARQLALQALYQWHMAGSSINDIEAQYLSDNEQTKFDIDFFRELLHQVPALVDEIDGHLTPIIDREQDDLDPIEHSILRIGCYELMKRPDVPYRVAINEGIELAKRFGASESHRYVNGILDRIALRVRRDEVADYRAKK